MDLIEIILFGNRANFVIKDESKPIYGVAQLIEIGSERYFIQFITESEVIDYSKLRRYLKYYVNLNP